MEASAIPLAFLAGLLSTLSPCVLPMLPAVASSAMNTSKAGLLMLALGLSSSFALAGSLLTYIFLNLEISTDILRVVTAYLLLFMGLALTFDIIGSKITLALSRVLSRLPAANIHSDKIWMQLFIGLSLGLVWLPCVGPTLGAAIALASMGENMLMAFTVMACYGLGTAIPLVTFGFFAGQSLARLKLSGAITRRILGISLTLLALSTMTGLDHQLSIWAYDILPDWAIDI